MAIYKLKRDLRDTGQSNRISVDTAARLLHVSAQFLRVGLQTGRFKFGWAVKTGQKNWTYYILKDRFEKETGITVEKSGGVSA